MAITQPQFRFPYTGRRYGSFAGKIPRDFMHGRMDIRPYLVGVVIEVPQVSGKILISPQLHGDIRTNP